MLTSETCRRRRLVLLRRYRWLAAVLLLPLGPVAAANSHQPPVADAGLSRYAGVDPITLDGSGSFAADDTSPLIFAWRQVAGPALELEEADTATPRLSGFVLNGELQRSRFELVVSDGLLWSQPDTVEVFIVSTLENMLQLANPPFDPERPTMVGYNGGRNGCLDGSALGVREEWYGHVNYLASEYTYPYDGEANDLLVFLSQQAPDYDQAIQTVGFSAGGNPAIGVAIYLNQTYQDPRYAVNRVTLLDSPCVGLNGLVARFNANPVAGEPAWVESFRVLPAQINGALNITFPGGSHNTPFEWFVASLLPDRWPQGDLYNHGLTAGFFVSVAGPGRNLRLATDTTHYYFECSRNDSDGPELWNPGYPGALPEPVTLIGPADGAQLDRDGACLTCEPSENAVSYQLLFGDRPASVTMVISETPQPPQEIVTDLPFTPTFWTVKARDRYGTTIHADPIALYPAQRAPAPRSPGRRVSGGG